MQRTLRLPPETPSKREAWVSSPTYRAVVQAIRSAREERGLSLRAVGATLGKPPSWLNKVELLERRLDVVEFVALARALGLSPHDLLDRILAAVPENFEL